MRIVAGMARGRRIEAPEGTDTRPTTDRVREALFSSLYSLRGGFEGACVLDAFAGSGALGLEALSRGARHATFYETNAKALACLRGNIAACGLGPDAARVLEQDVTAGRWPMPAHAFDLVFLDPPYSMEATDVMALVLGLREAGMLDAQAVVVYEHAQKARQSVEEAAQQAGLTVKATKKYGKTAVTTLIVQADPNREETL